MDPAISQVVDLSLPSDFVKAGMALIPVSDIRRVDLEQLEDQIVTIHTMDATYTSEGSDAIETVMLCKPSALEGRRLKWRKHAWAYHNLIAHPVMQIMVWMGRTRQAVAYHDRTTPRPR